MRITAKYNVATDRFGSQKVNPQIVKDYTALGYKVLV